MVGLVCVTNVSGQIQPEVAEFGKLKIPKIKTKMDTIPILIQPITITYSKHYDIELVHLSRYFQSSRIVISFTNQSKDFVDNFWLQASLLDKRKSFLYREQSLFFTKVKPGETVKADMLCESVGTDEIGYIVLSPMLLEVNDEDQIFDIEQVNIIPDTIHKIIVDFESRIE